jgi:hypothetical protein
LIGWSRPRNATTWSLSPIAARWRSAATACEVAHADVTPFGMTTTGGPYFASSGCSASDVACSNAADFKLRRSTPQYASVFSSRRRIASGCSMPRGRARGACRRPARRDARPTRHVQRPCTWTTSASVAAVRRAVRSRQRSSTLRHASGK